MNDSGEEDEEAVEGKVWSGTFLFSKLLKRNKTTAVLVFRDKEPTVQCFRVDAVTLKWLDHDRFRVRVPVYAEQLANEGRATIVVGQRSM